MLFKKSFWIVAAIAGLALVTAGCHAKIKDPAYMADYAVEKLTDKLDLTKDQQAKLEKIKVEVLAQHKEIKGERGQHFGLILDEFSKETLDTAKITAEMEAKQEKKSKHQAFMVEKLAEFHEILTPAQRTKLVEYLAEHKDKWGRHHGGHHGMF